MASKKVWAFVRDVIGIELGLVDVGADDVKDEDEARSYGLNPQPTETWILTLQNRPTF